MASSNLEKYFSVEAVEHALLNLNTPDTKIDCSTLMDLQVVIRESIGMGDNSPLNIEETVKKFVPERYTVALRDLPLAKAIILAVNFRYDFTDDGQEDLEIDEGEYGPLLQEVTNIEQLQYIYYLLGEGYTKGKFKKFVTERAAQIPALNGKDSGEISSLLVDSDVSSDTEGFGQGEVEGLRRVEDSPVPKPLPQALGATPHYPFGFSPTCVVNRPGLIPIGDGLMRPPINYAHWSTSSSALPVVEAFDGSSRSLTTNGSSAGYDAVPLDQEVSWAPKLSGGKTGDKAGSGKSKHLKTVSFTFGGGISENNDDHADKAISAGGSGARRRTSSYVSSKGGNSPAQTPFPPHSTYGGNSFSRDSGSGQRRDASNSGRSTKKSHPSLEVSSSSSSSSSSHSSMARRVKSEKNPPYKTLKTSLAGIFKDAQSFVSTPVGYCFVAAVLILGITAFAVLTSEYNMPAIAAYTFTGAVFTAITGSFVGGQVKSRFFKSPERLKPNRVANDDGEEESSDLLVNYRAESSTEATM